MPTPHSLPHTQTGNLQSQQIAYNEKQKQQKHKQQSPSEKIVSWPIQHIFSKS